MKPRHLVLTEAAFVAYVERTYGPGAQLHPSNRLTACGRHMGDLAVTTDEQEVTCLTCRKAMAA